MATERDYDSAPDRFRDASRLTRERLIGSANLYARIAATLTERGVRLVADIGCGEGALAEAMPTPSCRIVGLDASPTMLRAHPRPAVLGDAVALPFADAAFDAVIAVNMLYHLGNPILALREARRILAPGGLLIAAAISRDDSPELAHVWRPEPTTFDAEDAPGLVASVFDRVEVERWDAPLIHLPDHDTVRDYLIGRQLAPDLAAAAAPGVPVPVTVTKRGALVYGHK